MINFQIVFARMARLFCLQRNVTANSARDPGVWFILAEIFENSLLAVLSLLLSAVFLMLFLL